MVLVLKELLAEFELAAWFWVLLKVSVSVTVMTCLPAVMLRSGAIVMLKVLGPPGTEEKVDKPLLTPPKTGKPLKPFRKEQTY